MTTMTQDEKVQKELEKFLAQLRSATISMGLLRDMISATTFSMEQLQRTSRSLLKEMENTGLKSENPFDSLAVARGAFSPAKPIKPPYVPTPEPPPVEGDDLDEMAAGYPKEDS